MYTPINLSQMSGEYLIVGEQVNRKGEIERRKYFTLVTKRGIQDVNEMIISALEKEYPEFDFHEAKQTNGSPLCGTYAISFNARYDSETPTYRWMYINLYC